MRAAMEKLELFDSALPGRGPRNIARLDVYPSRHAWRRRSPIPARTNGASNQPFQLPRFEPIRRHSRKRDVPFRDLRAQEDVPHAF